MNGILDEKPDLNAQMRGLAANPFFNMGMGLMQSRYDPNVNPFTAAMQGLVGARQASAQDEEQKRAEQQRKVIADYFRSLGLQPPGENPYAGAEQMFGTGGTPGAIPFAGVPHGSALRDYVNEQAWKYQLGK